MRLHDIVARFVPGVLALCMSGMAVGHDISPEWQGMSLGAGSAVKQKMEGVQGRAVSLVGRSRSVSAWLDMAALDGWRWRPVITSGSVFRSSQDNGLLLLAAGAEVERGLGRVGQAMWPYIAFGFSPTLLSDDELGSVIIGGDVHFTSSVIVGLTLQAPFPVRIAYRLSHTSNGGIRTANPGVDISGLTLEIPVHFR